MSRYGVSESTCAAGSFARERVEFERREHDVLDGRGFAQRLLEDREHRHRLAAARRLALRDHHLRLARPQSLRDCRRGEAGEDRHLDRADVRDGVRGDGHLGRHRQEDRDTVAGADAERDETLGEPGHVARELGECQLAPRAVLAEPDRGDPVRIRGGPAVDAVVRDRDRAPDEPGRPVRTARVVEYPRPRPANSRPRSSTTSGQNHSGSVDRAAHQVGVARRSGASTRRVAFACRSVASSGRQTISLTRGTLRDGGVSVC